MNSVAHWKGDTAVGLGLALCGLVMFWLARDIPLGGLAQPGPGFLPTALGLALATCGVACAVRALRLRASAEEVSFLENSAVLTSLILAGAIAAFEPLGFLVTGVVFLGLLFKVLGAGGWVQCALLAVGVGGSAWAIFVKALAVQLPQGISPF